MRLPAISFTLIVILVLVFYAGKRWGAPVFGMVGL